MPEVVESDGDGAAALTERHAHIYVQARDRRSLDGIGCAVRQRSQALIGGRQLAGQELAFGPLQLQGEDQVVPALPAIVAQERRTGDEIFECRNISGRSLGALARDQVELGQLLPLLLRSDQGHAAVQLIDDVEDRLFTFFGRRVRRQQPSDAQMRLGAQCFRDQ